jgi:predicted MFS family arabinose efflux permease
MSIRTTTPRQTRLPTPLRRPAFARLWAAGLVSDAGDWMLFIALPVVVYGLTGSALGTSIAFVAELAPAVLLAPVAARIADRYDRRRVLLAVTVVQAIALLPLLAVHARADLPILYGVIMTEATLSALFEPTKNALLPTLLCSDELVGGNALVGLNQNLGRLIGGPTGGVLLAAGGLPAVVAVDVASFAVAAVLLAGLPRVDRTAPSAVPTARGAVRAAIMQPGVQPILAVTFVAQVAQGIFVVLFVLFVAQRLGGGSGEIGLLRGIQAVGSIAAGLVLTVLGRRFAPSGLVAWSAIAFGLIDLVVWDLSYLTTNAAGYVALFIVIGAPGVVMGTALVSALQRASADGQRGAAFSVLGSAMNLGQAVGMLAAGVLTATLGLMPMLNAQAGLYLAAGGLAAVTTRATQRQATVRAR